MRIPEIPTKPETRIETSTAMFMVATALFYDVLDIAPAAMMTVATGAAVAVGWIPFFGQIVGVGAIGVGIIMEWALSALIALAAFLHFFTWFHMQEVHLGFVDRFAIRRLLIWLMCVLLECLPIPFMSALPMLTISTCASIFLSWKEDREKLKKWERKVAKLEKLFGQFARMDSEGAHAALRSVLRAAKKDAATHARLKSKIHALENRRSTWIQEPANDNREAANDNIPQRRQLAA